jgi:hypothetical protein
MLNSICNIRGNLLLPGNFKVFWSLKFFPIIALHAEIECHLTPREGIGCIILEFQKAFM